MDQSTGQSLQGKRIAMLLTDGVEQVEYTEPRKFLEGHGAMVTLVSPKNVGNDIQGFNHLTPGDKFKGEKDVRDARPADFDALALPGGVANPDLLRLNAEAITFIEQFGREDKPIAAICHGPWTLIDADLVKGLRVTSWPSLKVDLSNAGAQWTDEQVVVAGRLVTSRKPDDIPAFNQPGHLAANDCPAHRPGWRCLAARASSHSEACDAPGPYTDNPINSANRLPSTWRPYGER